MESRCEDIKTMNNRINKTIEKAKKLIPFCPDKEIKDQIEQMIILIEMFKFTEEDVKKHIPEEDAKELEAAIATIDKLYSMTAAN